MDDALLVVTERVQTYAEFLGVPAQRVDLGLGDRVRDRLVPVEGGDVVVLGCQGQVGTANPAPGQTQAVKRMGRGDLVDGVEVDEEQVRLSVSTTNNVCVPPTIVNGLATSILQIGRAAIRDRVCPHV